MSRQRIAEAAPAATDGSDARRQVLAGAPVTERRVELAGVSTALLETGEGPPVVLLHGQGGWSGMWLPVVADMKATHRVIAADLPGLGGSGCPTARRTPPACSPGSTRWSATPARHRRRWWAPRSGPPSPPGSPSPTPDRVSRLVLVDAGSLGRFRPAPGVMLALLRFLARPSERTQEGFLRQVAVDPERARAMMGERWEASQAYNLDRARTPSVRAANRRMLKELGTKAIPSGELARIAVPTTLIWGRQDRVMRLRIAEAASARYGWPLHVIEDAGHFVVEQPEAFRRALRAALATPAGR
jgi:pimeloyl-ACP methyl ester carboxylesterase